MLQQYFRTTIIEIPILDKRTFQIVTLSFFSILSNRKYSGRIRGGGINKDFENPGRNKEEINPYFVKKLSKMTNFVAILGNYMA